MNRIGLIMARKKVLIFIAVLMVLACLVFFWYFRNTKDKTDAPGVLIFAAAEDIPAGEEISENMVKQEKISTEVFSDKFLTDAKDIYGKKTVEEIKKGEIINSAKVEGAVTESGQYWHFSSHIPAGHRAVTVPVNYYGQSSLLSRGDKIDLISTHYDDEKEKIISLTVLSYKEIILLSGKSQISDSDYDSIVRDSSRIDDSSVFAGLISQSGFNNPGSQMLFVTLYLTPKEAEDIMLYLQLGSLNLALCPG